MLSANFIFNEDEFKKIIKDVVREELSKIEFKNESPQYIKGIDNLAIFLGVGRSTAQKMKNDGVIPYVQYDRTVLFDKAKVMSALESATPKYNH